MKDKKNRNYKRLIEVWFDPYQHYVYHFLQHLRELDPGDLTERLQLKKQAPYDMKWLLENHYTQMIEIEKEALAWTALENNATKKCLAKKDYYAMHMGDCSWEPSRTNVYWTREGLLRRDRKYMRSLMHI